MMLIIKIIIEVSIGLIIAFIDADVTKKRLDYRI